MTAVTPQGKPDDTRNRTLPVVVTVAVAGILLGYLLGAGGRQGDSPTPPDPITGQVDPAQTATTGLPPATVSGEPPLADLVPGFVGTLIAQTMTWDARQTLTVWPGARSAPNVAPLRTGEVAVFDVSGEYLARLEYGAADVGSAPRALSVGPVRSAQATRSVALGVSSFAWHGSEPRRLAWLHPDETAPRTNEVLWELRTGRVEPNGAFTASEAIPTGRFPGVARLVAWDSWGFLVWGRGDAEPAVTLFTPDGDVMWTHRGFAVAVSPGGQVLLDTGLGPYTFVLASVHVADVEPVPLDWIRPVPVSATWSPDGLLTLVHADRIAEVSIETWDTNGNLLDRVEVPQTVQPGTVRWTPDGRFIVAASRGDVLFYDTVDQALYSVLLASTVRAVTVRQP